jgi:glycosyltransferase involved in cell wall biosynthesis
MKYTLPISVVMPCYNIEEFVSEAIESILSQSFSDFEFIIVNDGSEDSTHAKILKFKDDRIKYIRLPANKGNYSARNLGMKIAIGKYICVMDSDDIALPDRLKVQYEYMELHPFTGAIGGQAMAIDGNGMEEGNISAPLCSMAQLRVFLLMNNFVTHPTLFLRHRLLKKYNLSYDETYKVSADYDFIIRCASLFSVRNIQDIVLKYRRHDNQISKNKRATQLEYANQIRVSQLKGFGLDPDDEEIKTYLRLFNKEPFITQNELDIGLSLFNKILENNFGLKLYSQRMLYNLFDFVIAEAQTWITRGMSIESELLTFIKTVLGDKKTILEFGSGSGTKLLLKSYNVISIEHEEAYAIKLKDNHECIYSPIVDNVWYDPKKVAIALKNQFDLVLVDGPPRELRKGIIANIELFRHFKIPVIFDDVNRPLDRKTMVQFCKEIHYKFKIFDGKLKQFAYCVPK